MDIITIIPAIETLSLEDKMHLNEALTPSGKTVPAENAGVNV